MRLATIHAVLLVLALGFAYQTWTRDEVLAAGPGSVVLWNERPEAIRRVHYEAENISVELQRREDDAGEYVWGIVRRPAPERRATGETIPPEEGVLDAEETPTGTETVEFVLGQDGDIWLGEVARLVALRDLGVPDAEQERVYGLDEPSGALVIEFDGTRRELAIGGSVFGTVDRYARDHANGRVYVLRSRFVRNLEDGDRTLADRRLHAFELSQIGTATVRTAGDERTMLKGEAPASAPTSPPWFRESAPDQPDQTFANFMERLRRLWAVEYLPDVDPRTLTRLVRIDYHDPRGRPIGFEEVLRRDVADGAEYFVWTEHTRVPVRIYENAGQQIEGDVNELF